MCLTLIAGKAGVQFYTQIKTVAQQWKDLPSVVVPPAARPSFEKDVTGRGMSSTLLSTSERGSPCQRVSVVVHSSSESGSPTSESDLPNPGVSSMSPTSDADMPSNGMSLVMPAASQRDLSTGDMSLAMPLSTDRDLESQGVSLRSHQMSERLCLPQTSRWNESLPPTSQRTETIASTSDRIHVPKLQRNGNTGLSSQKTDTAMSLTSERLCMPMSHENIGSMSHRNDGMAATTHHMENAVHPSSERVYLLATSHLNDSMSPPFQRTDTMFSTSERLYMPSATHRSDHLGTTSQRTDIGLQSNSERIYMSTASQRNDNLAAAAASQQADSMPSTSERIYMSPLVHRNAGMPPNSDRLFIPSTTQRMYPQNPLIPMDEFPNQGASLTLPTSQRI